MSTVSLKCGYDAYAIRVKKGSKQAPDDLNFDEMTSNVSLDALAAPSVKVAVANALRHSDG